jgi:hypothetical protein
VRVADRSRTVCEFTQRRACIAWWEIRDFCQAMLVWNSPGCSNDSVLLLSLRASVEIQFATLQAGLMLPGTRARDISLSWSSIFLNEHSSAGAPVETRHAILRRVRDRCRQEADHAIWNLSFSAHVGRGVKRLWAERLNSHGSGRSARDRA